jgi:hypothetical protein
MVGCDEIEAYSFTPSEYIPNVPDAVKNLFHVPISSYGTEKEVMRMGEIEKEVYVAPLDVHGPKLSMFYDCRFEDFFSFSQSPLSAPDVKSLNKAIDIDTKVVVHEDEDDSIGKTIRYTLDHVVFQDYKNIVVINPYPGTVSRALKVINGSRKNTGRSDVVMLFTDDYRKTASYEECVSRVGVFTHRLTRYEDYEFNGDEVVYFHFRADLISTFKKKVRDIIGWEMNPYSSQFNNRLMMSDTTPEGVEYTYFYGHVCKRQYLNVPLYFRYHTPSTIAYVMRVRDIVYSSDLFHFCSTQLHPNMFEEVTLAPSVTSPLVPGFAIDPDNYSEVIHDGINLKLYRNEDGQYVDCNIPVGIEQRHAFLHTMTRDSVSLDSARVSDLIGIARDSSVNMLITSTFDSFETYYQYIFPGTVSFDKRVVDVVERWKVHFHWYEYRFIHCETRNVHDVITDRIYEVDKGYDLVEDSRFTPVDNGAYQLVFGVHKATLVDENSKYTSIEYEGKLNNGDCFFKCCEEFYRTQHTHSHGIYDSTGLFVRVNHPFVYSVSGVSYVYSKEKLDRDCVPRNVYVRQGEEFGCPYNKDRSMCLVAAGVAMRCPPYMLNDGRIGVIGKVFYTDVRPRIKVESILDDVG